MADVTVKSFDEMDSWKGEGRFSYAGKSLGVSAWAMNLMRLPPNWGDYPEHDHADDGQEEVYIVLEGSATLEADGETWKLEAGNIARVGPTAKRRLTPGDEGVTMVALGGTPGKAYEPRQNP